MLTRDQLAAILAQVPVEELAAETGLSSKTIYRLRHKKNSPTLDTVTLLLDAVARIKPAALKAKAPA